MHHRSTFTLGMGKRLLDGLDQVLAGGGYGKTFREALMARTRGALK